LNAPQNFTHEARIETDFQSSSHALLALREHLVIDHPINTRVSTSQTNLFELFELYAHFVYNFNSYVGALFSRISDIDAKAHIYENLLEEIGFQPGKQAQWGLHHGELYRSFLASLRKTSAYRSVISEDRTRELDLLSREISERFYAGHFEILRKGNDRLTVAAFSSIEGWVSREYAMWRELLGQIGDDVDSIDLRTIDLHCECDIEHSRVLDSILRGFLTGDDRTLAAHEINSGLLRGIALSVGLFDDIDRALATAH
jgi:hypothetical protein